MKAARLDARGMITGVGSAKYFIMIACKEYFERKWPLFELLIADMMKKPIIVVVETDKRNGGISLDTFCSQLHKIWKRLLDHELIKVQRRYPYRAAFISELKRRCSRDKPKVVENREVEAMNLYLSNNTDDKSLHLWREKLGMKPLKWWKVFVDVFRDNDLDNLTIGADRLTKEHMMNLGPALALSKLLHLNLAHNYMGDEECIMLSKYLPIHLEKLFLMWNKITDEGCTALCKSIPKNLIFMNLENNKIGNDGFREVLKVLETSSNSLEEVLVQGNDANDDSILKSIEEHKS